MGRRIECRLRPLALEVNDSELCEVAVYSLEMPEVWVKFIQQFRKDPAYPRNLTIKPSHMGNKLQNLLPDIIWVNDEACFQEGKTWIIAKSPVPIHMITAFCMSWFQGEVFKEKQAPRLRHLISMPAGLDEQELAWKSGQLSQVLNGKNDYQIIPAIMAHRFCLTPKRFTEEPSTDLPHQLQFYYVHGHSSQAECMSERITTKRGQFSYIVRVRMITRGGQADQRVIQVSFGVRRFVADPYIKENECYIKSNTRSSMLVTLDNPFLRKQGIQSRSYAKVWFERKKREGALTQWVEGCDSIFWDVLWGETVATDDILRNPARYLEKEGFPFQALIVHNRLFRASKVGAGLGFPEKEALFDLFCQEFEHWKPLGSLPAVFKDKMMKLSQLPLFYTTESKTLTLEIWGSTDLREQVRLALADFVEKQPIAFFQDEDHFRLNCNQEFVIKLIYRGEAAFLRSLEKVEDLNQSTHSRMNEIARALKQDTQSTGIRAALVEILPRNQYSPEDTDPKMAIRGGFRQAGRLTQFVHPKDTKDTADFRFRVRKAVLDLLADTGVVGKKMNTISSGYQILGFDLMSIRKRSSRSKFEKVFVPVFTKFDAGVLSIRGWGMDGWLTLHEAQLQADQFKGWTKKKEEAVQQLLEEVLLDEIGEQKTILLVNAQLREFIRALKNANMRADSNPAILPWFPTHPNLRVIRINATDEVPAYLLEPRSQVGGVYQDANGLYYGVGSKMSTNQVRMNKTKYAYPKESFRQQRNTEYMPMGYENEEERSEAALLMHSLRDISITFDTHTAQPYPFHMLRSLEKYMHEVFIESEAIEPEFEEGDE